MAKLVRAIIGAPRQRAASREVDARRRGALVHPLHVDVIETHRDAERLGKPIDADRAMLIELGFRSGGNGRVHSLGRKRATDRKSVVSGKSGSVRVDLGGRRILKKKKQQM